MPFSNHTKISLIFNLEKLQSVFDLLILPALYSEQAFFKRSVHSSSVEPTEAFFRMAVETNWQAFLSQNSALPPDVFFRIKGNGEEAEENIGKVARAHIFLLAGISPVFLQQFFVPTKDTKEVLKVVDTTPEAFNTMLSYIYKLPGEDTFSLDETYCPQKLFELLELAERYQIPNLAKVTAKALETLQERS